MKNKKLHLMLMEKLVRDKIVKEMKKQGKNPKFRILNSKEYLASLKDKLVEESLEVKNSKNKKQIKEEIADVYEVMKALMKANHISFKDIKKSAKIKKKIKGAFKRKLSLILKKP